MTPCEEDFEAWRDHPVTQWIMAILRQQGERQKGEWMRVSWDNGGANTAVLQELRVRATAYGEIIGGDYDMWSGLDEQSERN